MSKTTKKWIDIDAVGAANLLLENNQGVRSRNSQNTANLEILKLDSANNVIFPLIPRLANNNPSQDDELVTVKFVRDYAKGIRDPKDAVRLLSDSNLSLTGSAPIQVDGFTVNNGDRLGLIGQTDLVQNGLYDYSESGGNYTLTRADDADNNAEVTQGLSFGVSEGSIHQADQVILVTEGVITVGTSDLNFIVVPNAATLHGGDMVSKLGRVFSVDLATTSGLESTNPGNSSGQLRVRISDAVLQKNRTTKISASNAIESLRSGLLNITLSGSDISNGFLDLPEVANDGSVKVTISGAPPQLEGTDFSVNYTAGSQSKTRIFFIGDLSTTIAAGDKVQVDYLYL